ncbi:MAG TPA: DinB family protein [Acidimicrobiales bacterium]|nr:DinB family protein [Acidimicrobiales bacterium]
MAAQWTAPPVERSEPGNFPEREALEAWVDYHRGVLLWKCSGLTAEQLKRRSVPPSNLSLLGIVRHMTEVERWWFRIHAGDQDMELSHSTDDNPEGDFNDLEAADAEADLDAYRAEIQAAKQTVAAKQLDDRVRSHGHHQDREVDIRWIYLHMIEEYARHNGHADLLRECIDGATGE